MSFRLAIVSGKGAGREFFFSQRSVRIGRRADNDLVLYDTAVSRNHCEVLQEASGFLVRDLGSANGVLLNEQLVTEAKLQEGDRIQVGPVVFEFRIKKGPRPTPAGEPAPVVKERVFAPEGDDERAAFEAVKTAAHDRPDFSADQAPESASGEPEPAPPPLVDEPPPASPAEPARRTETGSFKSARPTLLVRWRSAPSQTRRAVLLAGGIVLVGILAAGIIVGSRPKRDRSGELFSLEPAVAGQRFGAGKVDVHTPDRANFQFTHGGGRLTIGFAVGGVETQKELAILVNGKLVGHAPLSPERWSFGHTLRLPREVLQPGTNILTFDDTKTPAEDERWGVSQVVLNETPLPPPDEKRAAQLFELGKGAYDTRSVTPPNLWRAAGYFDEAKSFLEAMPERPPLWAEIEKAEQKAQDELQGVFDSHVFAAEKAQRFGNEDEAAQLLRELMRYFPDSTDTRHKQAKARLNSLTGDGIQ